MSSNSQNIKTGGIIFERYVRCVEELHSGPSSENIIVLDTLVQVAYRSLRELLSLGGAVISSAHKNRLDISLVCRELITDVHDDVYDRLALGGIIGIIRPNPLVNPRMPGEIGRVRGITVAYLMDGVPASEYYVPGAVAYDLAAKAARSGAPKLRSA